PVCRKSRDGTRSCSRTRRDTPTVQQLQLQQQEFQRDNQRLQSELQECHSTLKVQEAELQRANNTANNAEHRLTKLSLKLSNSEQLEQQVILLNQQLVVLRETNRALTEQLEGGEGKHWTVSRRPHSNTKKKKHTFSMVFNMGRSKTPPPSGWFGE
ncbi:hamartin-like, partial [Cynoglossus semilaevis]|uniref:hamartin-like n=1 Tax=Cynoglossus semilaevis TaxID=244447 RepID=UPI0007DC9CFF